MSELSSAGLSAFKEVFEPIGDAIAMALSENINQLVQFDPLVISQEQVGTLIGDSSLFLQTSFTLPELSEDEATIIFAESDAPLLFNFVELGDGSNPPDALDEAQIERLGVAMAGFVHGLGVAIGNALNRPVVPGDDITTQLAPISLSGGILAAGCALQIAFPYRVDGLVDSNFRLLISPALARSMAGTTEDDTQSAEDLEPASTIDFPSLGSPQFGFSSPAPAPSPFQPYDENGGGAEAMPRGLDLIMDIPLDVSVELGRVQMLIKDVLELATGSIVELDRVAGEPIDLMVNGQLVAKGEVVVIEDNFGIRITEIVSPADRLNSAGKRAA